MHTQWEILPEKFTECRPDSAKIFALAIIASGWKCIKLSAINTENQNILIIGKIYFTFFPGTFFALLKRIQVKTKFDS